MEVFNLAVIFALLPTPVHVSQTPQTDPCSKPSSGYSTPHIKFSFDSTEPDLCLLTQMFGEKFCFVSMALLFPVFHVAWGVTCTHCSSAPFAYAWDHRPQLWRCLCSLSVVTVWGISAWGIMGTCMCLVKMYGMLLYGCNQVSRIRETKRNNLRTNL